MKPKPTRSASPKYLYWVLVTFLMGIAVVLRFGDITADLPPYFSGGGQDFTTDASYLTLYAKTAVQFGSWDLFDFEPWSAFKISIVSGLSYLLFSIIDVSRQTAALTGAILQLGGLLLFVIGLSRHISRSALLLVIALLATNYVLILYGRVPFAENGLIFLAGLTFLVFSYWFDRIWGILLVGLLIALTALLGKSFGFFLLGGALLYVAVRRQKGWLHSAAYLVGATAATTLLFTAFFHGDGGLFDFLYEYGVGEHGAPHGFSSIQGFFESLIGVTSLGLHQYIPLLSLFTFVAMLLPLFGEFTERHGERVYLFMVGWLAVWLVVLSPFNYHPIRYFYPLTIPMIAILAVTIDWLRTGYSLRRSFSYWRIPLCFLLTWYASYVTIIGVAHDTLDPTVLFPVVWRALPIAVGIVLALLIVSRLMTGKLVLRRSALAAVIIGLSISAYDLYQFYAWFSLRSHTIDNAGQDTVDLLGPGAVIGGQYGPAFAADGKFGSLRLFLRDDLKKFENDCREYPVTHLALATATMKVQMPNSDLLGKAPVLGTYYLRNNVVRLVRISHLTGNDQAAKYHPTEFERATDLMYADRLTEAHQALESFLKRHPRNKAALTELYYLTQFVRGLNDAQPLMDELVRHFGDDLSVTLLAAIYYKHLGKNRNDRWAGEKGKQFFEQAVRRSGPNADKTRLMYENYLPSDRVVQ